MISYAVEKLEDEYRPSADMMAKLKQYQREDLILESNIEFECDKIKYEFDSRSISVLFLKGMILKHYYPLCSMRTMSDVDLIYREEDKDKIKKLFRELGYKCVVDFDGELSFSKPPFYYFEFHPRLEFTAQHTCDSFSQLWSTSRVVQDGRFSTLSLENTYIYMMEHLAKHIEKAGAGIRMVLDILVFLNAEGKKLNKDVVDTGLAQLKLTAFSERIKQLADNWFASDDPDTQSVTADFILNSSTFGLSSNAILQSNIRKEKRSGKKQSGIKAILRKIFPEYSYICGRFSSAKKLWFLYPFYIPAYWCLRVFKDRNISTDNFGNYFVKTDSEQAKYLLEAMNDMGLTGRF